MAKIPGTEIVYRKFRPGSRPPKTQRAAPRIPRTDDVDHLMLSGGREGPNVAARKGRGEWDGSASERYSDLLGSARRVEATPTQSPYLVRVRPELRGWERGISTIEQMEQAALPIETLYPVSPLRLNVDMFAVNKNRDALDHRGRPLNGLIEMEVTVIATNSIPSSEVIPERVRLTPFPLRMHVKQARFVDEVGIEALADGPEKEAILTILARPDNARFPTLKMNQDAFQQLRVKFNAAWFKATKYYQKYVGLLGRISEGVLAGDGDQDIFISYSFIARLRQIYPKNQEYPYRISAEETKNFIDPQGIDFSFIEEWGPEIYTMVTQRNMTPDEAIMNLRMREGRRALGLRASQARKL